MELSLLRSVCSKHVRSLERMFQGAKVLGTFAPEERKFHRSESSLDLDTGLSSKILKFADDTKIFRPVMNHTDGLGLQQDLDSISNWARQWQMKFNVSKCKVMQFGKGNIHYRYIMDKQALEKVDCEKDLGVNVCKI